MSHKYLVRLAGWLAGWPLRSYRVAATSSHLSHTNNSLYCTAQTRECTSGPLHVHVHRREQSARATVVMVMVYVSPIVSQAKRLANFRSITLTLCGVRLACRRNRRSSLRTTRPSSPIHRRNGLRCVNLASLVALEIIRALVVYLADVQGTRCSPQVGYAAAQ